MSGPESRAKFIQPDVIGLNLTMQRILLINDTFLLLGQKTIKNRFVCCHNVTSAGEKLLQNIGFPLFSINILLLSKQIPSLFVFLLKISLCSSMVRLFSN